jgi:mono/diheme cytochrome c family protein
MNGRILTLAFIAVVAIGIAPAFAQGDAAKGAAVFAAQKCSMCHSVAGKGGKLALDGPDAKLNKLSAAEIQEWITHPADAAKKHKSTAKPPMRAYASLPKADLDNLVAYMQSLQKK